VRAIALASLEHDAFLGEHLSEKSTLAVCDGPLERPRADPIRECSPEVESVTDAASEPWEIAEYRQEQREPSWHSAPQSLEVAGAMACS
jgi:hypothetical protein